MSKRSTTAKLKVHVQVDREVWSYFQAQLYSHTEGRFKYGFSGLVNRLLWDERARQVARAAAEAQAAHEGGHAP